MASCWTCKKCSYINSPTFPSSSSGCCKICLSPPSPTHSSSSSCNQETPKWSCKACTFFNPYNYTNCEICGTRASLSAFEVLDDDLRPLDDGYGDLGSCVGSVFLPLRSCKREERDPLLSALDGLKKASDSSPPSKKRISANGVDVKAKKEAVVSVNGSDVKAAKKAVSVVNGDDNSSSPPNSLKIMSYNVWFREDLELHGRMRAIGNLVQLHSPDIICFQEVTPDIYDIFHQSSWWKAYSCSLSKEMADTRPYYCMMLSKELVKSFTARPFYNTMMGRELCIAELEVQGNIPLVVATSHLESPCPGPPTWDQMFSKERVEQAEESIDRLKLNPNVIFCGDMNWDDKVDGQFPLADGWIDAWSELKPGDVGWTYDTKLNQMLTANRKLQKRLDRFICNLRDFRITEIEMIGKEAIPGLSYTKDKKVRNEVKKLVLPVLPSDHYGLLLTISST